MVFGWTLFKSVNADGFSGIATFFRKCLFGATDFDLALSNSIVILVLGRDRARLGGLRDAAQGAAGPAPAALGPGVPGRQGVPGAADHGLAGPRF